MCARYFTAGLVLSLIVALPYPVPATTIHVPTEQSTIQDGLDSASPGDTVLVAAGTYTGSRNRNLDFGGRDVVLLSEDGAQTTIINCQHAARAFHIHQGETAAAEIKGFTIINGRTYDEGGAMLCNESSPTIADCIFEDNETAWYGGAIRIRSSSSLITNCSFINNNTDDEVWFGFGGALDCTGCPSLTLENCRFTGNCVFGMGGAVSFSSGDLFIEGCDFAQNWATWSMESHGRGGALFINSGIVDLENCTFIDNGSSSPFPGGAEGGAIASEGDLVVRDCLIVQNITDGMGGAICASGETEISGSTLTSNCSYADGGALHIQGGATLLKNTICWGNSAENMSHEVYVTGIVSFTCCAIDSSGIAGGGTVLYLGDQVFSDPFFCDPQACGHNESGDYRLRSDSPCLPDSSPCGELIGLLDEGCQSSSVPEGTILKQTTWGNMKHQYLR